MTIVHDQMPTEELVAYLKEADDFAQLSDIQCSAVRQAVRIAIRRLDKRCKMSYVERFSPSSIDPCGVHTDNKFGAFVRYEDYLKLFREMIK